MDKHRKLYKAKADVSDIRNQRTNQTIELRQSRRDDIILQKRMMPNKEETILNVNENDEMLTYTRQILDNNKEKDLIQGALSDKYDERLIALKAIRTILSNRDYRPVDLLLKVNVLSALYKCIERDNETDIQYEALWSLTNIASGESHQTYAIVEHNFLPLLYKTLQSSCLRVAEQTAWTLANIAGEGFELRDKIIEHNFLDLIFELVKKYSISSQSSNCVPFLQNIAWLMINIVRSKSDPITEPISLKTLAINRELLLNFSTDSKIVSDSLWSISFLIDSCPSNATIVVESGILKIAVGFIGHSDEKLVLGMIRCLGNLSAGPDLQTDHVCSLNVIPYFGELLQYESVKIVQETLWLISNIAAGTVDQMRSILVESIISKVLRHLQFGLYIHQKEAQWIISNIIHNGNTEDSMKLVDMGVLESMKTILKSKDSALVKHALESYAGLFRLCGDTLHIIQQRLEVNGVIDALDNLVNHPKEDISNLANDILSKYALSSNTVVDYMENDTIDMNTFEDKPYFF